MWVSCSARWLHEPSPPTRLIIFIVTDVEPSCPQTLHLFGEAGHAQTNTHHSGSRGRRSGIKEVVGRELKEGGGGGVKEGGLKEKVGIKGEGGGGS